MKDCFKCHQRKPLTEFYAHSQMRDGHLNKCKTCTRRDVAQHRTENIDSVRAYDRARAKTEHRIKHAVAVTKSWRARGPAARVAHHAVGNALQSGTLKRKPCEACGSKRVHAHHDDYLNPLDVRWLCAEHHKAHHIKQGPGLNASAVPPNKRRRAA